MIFAARSRLFRLGASVLLVGSGLVLPATPAAAHSLSGLPDRAAAPARYANIDGGNWSGVVVARGSAFSSVSATWTEPKVSCTHRKDLMAPWVGIDGWGSSSVEQTGVETSCESGKPRYQAWYEMYPAPPVYFHNTVKAGDVISAGVSRKGNRYTLKISNKTRHWTRTVTRTKSAHHASAEVVLESPTAAYPRFGTLKFRSVKINGKSPSSYHHLRLDASNKHGRENTTSSVSSSGAFSIRYKRE